jgi:hypothetical protein
MSDIGELFYEASVAKHDALRALALAPPAVKTQAESPPQMQPLIATPPPFAGPQIPQPFPQVP